MGEGKDLPTTSLKAGGVTGLGKGGGWGSFAMPSSPMDEVVLMDAARDGARDGTAVGTSSVAPATTGKGGRENTRGGFEGRFDEGDGAWAECSAAPASRGATASEIRIVLSVKASISSADDWVGRRPGAGVRAKGSGECCRDRADASEPGPEDCDDELEPFFDDFVERAPPRKRLARTIVGESVGNHGLRHAQQKGVVQVAQA